MKVPIAYDGADAALDDLAKAGLGNDIEALVLSIAELWLPPPAPSDTDESFPFYPPPGLKTAREHVAARARVEQESERTCVCSFSDMACESRKPMNGSLT